MVEAALAREDYGTFGQRLREAWQSSAESGYLSNHLRILVIVARLLAGTGRSELSAASLAYVQHHQASTAQTRDKAGRLLAKLAAQLPPGSVEAAGSRFGQDPPGAVVEQVLAQL